MRNPGMKFGSYISLFAVEFKVGAKLYGYQPSGGASMTLGVTTTDAGETALAAKHRSRKADQIIVLV